MHHLSRANHPCDSETYTDRVTDNGNSATHENFPSGSAVETRREQGANDAACYLGNPVQEALDQRDVAL